MTYGEFLDRLREYYGDWDNESVVRVVLGYLKRDIKEDRLSELLRYVFYTHPVRYGPPDVSVLETAIYRKVSQDNLKSVKKLAALPEGPEPLQKPTIEDYHTMDSLLEKWGGLNGLIKGTMDMKTQGEPPTQSSAG